MFPQWSGHAAQPAAAGNLRGVFSLRLLLHVALPLWPLLHHHPPQCLRKCRLLSPGPVIADEVKEESREDIVVVTQEGSMIYILRLGLGPSMTFSRSSKSISSTPKPEYLRIKTEVRHAQSTTRPNFCYVKKENEKLTTHVPFSWYTFSQFRFREESRAC